MQDRRPHVVIIGAGFGGLAAARSLSRAPVRITVLDRKNHHLFQPLLYQVATSALNGADVAAPIRKILRRQKNTTVLLAEVQRIDVEQKKVVHGLGEIHYDYLIVATGATHAYFGHDEWAQHAPGLKTLEDALRIRRKVLLAFEAAEAEGDPERRRPWLNFVVVGAGPTGVELAGALTEIARHTLTHDFRNFDPSSARVILVEGADRVLTAFPPELSAKALKQLEDIGVEVRLNTIAKHIDQRGIQIGDEFVEARTILWAAGVKASPLGASLGAPTDRVGRVKVQPDLSLPAHPEVFVVGDLAAVESEGKPVPGVSPAALQGGRHVAAMIKDSLAGKPRVPFKYFDKGIMATIGRKRAVAYSHGIKMTGLVAWLAWLFVHVLYLVGYRNRFSVLLDWAYAYVTFQRSARIIMADEGRLALPPPPSDAKIPAYVEPSRSAP